MTRKTTAERIADAAKSESMNRTSIVYRQKANEAIDARTSLNIFTPGHVSVYLVSIDETPITFSDFRRLKPNIRATRGAYTIQYIPMGSMRRNPKFPYLIGQDLVRIRVTVSGPKHWAAMCSRIPELDWIRRNSTLSDAMFSVAKMHPGLTLRFGIDFVKYCDKITKKAEELGIDIDHKPLVTYQWGADSVPVVEDGTLDPVKTKEDYARELEEAQSDISREEDI